jgi:hypothetical protein
VIKASFHYAEFFGFKASQTVELLDKRSYAKKALNGQCLFH